MQAVEDLVPLQEKDVAHFPHQFGDQDELPDHPGIHFLLEVEAHHPLKRILSYPGNSGSADVFAQVGAESRGDHGVGVLLFREVETKEIRVGGKEKVLFVTRTAKVEKKIGAVHLVNLGDELPRDLPL
jgi:hypothetical protein